MVLQTPLGIYSRGVYSSIFPPLVGGGKNIKGQIDGEENQRKGEENQRKGEGQSGRIEGENGRKVKREEKIKKVKGNEISVKTKEAVFSMILFELSA